jgi:hypothetical protein
MSSCGDLLQSVMAAGAQGLNHEKNNKLEHGARAKANALRSSGERQTDEPRRTSVRSVRQEGLKPTAF